MKNTRLAEQWLRVAFFNYNEKEHGREYKDSGKGSNTFYDKNTLFSYGRHYALAYVFGYDNKAIVLINKLGYSNTTARHRQELMKAIHRLGLVEGRDYAFVGQLTQLANRLEGGSVDAIKDIMPEVERYYKEAELGAEKKEATSRKHKQFWAGVAESNRWHLMQFKHNHPVL